MVTLSAMPETHAFAPETYAQSSVLASGRWVKIQIENSGVYGLSRATLARMGFNNPERVRVYGYGAPVKSNQLTAKDFIDDLPMVQTATRADGTVVFYGQGPYSWKRSSTTYIRDLNLYATAGTYFVTEVADTVATRDFPATATPGTLSRLVTTTFTDRLHHEVDLYSPGQSGAILVGEDFKFTPKRTFNFKLTDRAEDDGPVNIETSFVAKTFTNSSSIEMTVNQDVLPAITGDRIPATANDAHYHGQESIGRRTVNVSGDKMDITIRHSASVSIQGAWLNYLAINYPRRLNIGADGVLNFWLTSSTYSSYRLSGAPASGLHLWDVTDPLNIKTVDYKAEDNGTVCWTPNSINIAEYVAWTENAKLPEPTIGATISNQNLHAHQAADMVIITLPSMRAQAERLANIHRADKPDPLTVNVVDVEQIYNEFGSGTADPWAIRGYLKMIYDRAQAQGTNLRYALILGRPTCDTRGLTDTFKALGIQTIPAWYAPVMSHALSDNTGFGTDDFYAMLKDNSCYDMAKDDHDIAVGRMPVRSAKEATAAIDKLEKYLFKMPDNDWRNRILLLADDQDNGAHMKQAEAFQDAVNPDDNPGYVLNKVYQDAYELTNGTYPEAREMMFKNLNDGVMLWIYLGHASTTSWGHEHQLTYNDINTRLFYKTLPVVFAGTCDFMRWDQNEESGAEMMFHNANGGVISMISASRPVFISENGKYTAALGRAFNRANTLSPDMRLGDFYRIAKNDIRDANGKHESNSNRLRYALMGDPAMPLALPVNKVNLLTVEGVDVTADAGDDARQAVVQALQQATFAGNITDADGNLMSDFNGSLSLTIYDADFSTTSRGNGAEGEPVTFNQHGNKLFAGMTTVTDGTWQVKVPMPMEIDDNFRPALAGMYAWDTSTGVRAAGANNRFYVYGTATVETPDTIPPVINSFVLNHSSFKNGDMVNLSPTVLATVSDNIGINISSAGIGHQILLTLDDTKTYTDVTSYFKPSTDGSPSGTISYPLENLIEGQHTLRLRVWDTSGNSTTQTIEFVASPKASPTIYDVWTDAGPATNSANFYVSHDRPDQTATVTITVYNLLGAPIWSGSQTGPADMFTSTPVVWDLTDNAGRRVNRGIYLYRATITTDGERFDTASKKIAVAAY